MTRASKTRILAAGFVEAWKARTISGVVLLLACAAGCGSSGPYGLTRVKGTVRYDDGSVIPAHRIEIQFHSMEAPLDAKTHPRPGLCEVNTSDGKFSTCSTYDFNDGIITGRHKVVIASMDERNWYTPHVPPEYRSVETTPLEVDSKDSPFEFKVPPSH